jgi:hypothetical protein
MILWNFKISFYLSSYAHKMLGKQRRVDYFITVCTIVQRDDGRETVVEGNDTSGWSSDGVASG